MSAKKPEVTEYLRDRTGHIRYDVCSCGERKTQAAQRCKSCDTEYRLDRAVDALPKPNAGNYFPRRGRYGILAVSGVTAMNEVGTTFSVVDGADCYREIRRLRAIPRTYTERRAKLVAWVDELNSIDRAVRPRGA